MDSVECAPTFFHSTLLSHLIIQQKALLEIMAEQPQRCMKVVDERTLRKDLRLRKKILVVVVETEE